MNGALRLGVIADDYTGASDLGSRLHEQGASAGLVFGLPDRHTIRQLAGTHDAVIVALKSRAVDPGDAVRASVEALDRLSSVAPAQVLFKYCSTFDSTAWGNIGPVTDALLEARGLDCTIAVPALPVNGRTQYLGHLFVNGVLLDESPMRHHPLNPMTDANLVRHLASQTRRSVGLVGLDVVRAGAPAVRAALERARSDGHGIVLVDAIANADLLAIGEACYDMALVTGGSGLGWGIVPAWARDGWRPAPHDAAPSVKRGGAGGLIIAGSCSAATLGQLEAIRDRGIPLLQTGPAVDVRLLPRVLGEGYGAGHDNHQPRGRDRREDRASPQEPGKDKAGRKSFIQPAKRKMTASNTRTIPSSTLDLIEGCPSGASPRYSGC